MQQELSLMAGRLRRFINAFSGARYTGTVSGTVSLVGRREPAIILGSRDILLPAALMGRADRPVWSRSTQLL